MYVYVIIVYEVYLQQNRYENESKVNVHTIMMHLVQNLRILHTKQIQKKKEMIIQI